MRVNQQWVIREKELSGPSAVCIKICPYFRKIYSVASYSADGQCLAGVDFTSRFCTAKDMGEYCRGDYQECPLYKVVTAGGVWQSQQEDAGAWPSP